MNRMASTSSLRLAAMASELLGVLVIASALAGLVAPGFYRVVHPVLLAGSYGQNWMSLTALPGLAWAVRVARRGSLRGVVVWLGLLAYYLYAYARYAFGPQLTVLYPLYVAIVSLSSIALVAISLSLEISVFDGRFHGKLPTRQIIVLFGAIVIVLVIPADRPAAERLMPGLDVEAKRLERGTRRAFQCHHARNT